MNNKYGVKDMTIVGNDYIIHDVLPLAEIGLTVDSGSKKNLIPILMIIKAIFEK